ncbi:MAG: hypothetical protein JXA42_21270 [Anaerolineales bacterium]|nr:hypothetical protein [Anaerolineales bacterium]
MLRPKSWIGEVINKVLVRLQAYLEATLMDIGARTGSWANYPAWYARRVTTIEQSPAKIEVMEQKMKSGGIDNVEIVGLVARCRN